MNIASERGSRRAKGALWASLVLVGIGTLVVAFSAGYMRSAGPEANGAADSEAESVDARWLAIPASEAEFRTLGGKKTSLADYRGRVVILNLWGTWCPPCRREIPELVALQGELEERGATIVSIAVDSGSRQSIRSFAAEFGIDYPIWVSGTDEVVRHFRVVGFPFTLLIDRDGLIRKQYLGPQTRETLLADAEVWIGEGSPTETPKYSEASEVGS